LKDKISELSRQMLIAETDGAKKEWQNQIVATEKLLARTNNLPDKTDAIPINAGCFIESSGEMVYLFGGTRNGYMEFNAVYLLMETMMKNCYELGIKRYNFYGVSGVFDARDPSFGVLAFKQAFGGEIEELIGNFTLIISRRKYFVARNLAKGKSLAKKILGKN
jgi:lipid II:glycine glycyltransferase (peptidoglycan interpeptide bridge formation enzyme)